MEPNQVKKEKWTKTHPACDYRTLVQGGFELRIADELGPKNVWHEIGNRLCEQHEKLAEVRKETDIMK